MQEYRPPGATWRIGLYPEDEAFRIGVYPPEQKHSGSEDIHRRRRRGGIPIHSGRCNIQHSIRSVNVLDGAIKRERPRLQWLGGGSGSEVK